MSSRPLETPDGFFTATLAEVDPEIADAIGLELGRQRDKIELIASENIVSKAVLEAQGSILTNKYAEGYPGRRYYGGCEYVDVVETLAIERAKQLFGANFANVQANSGSQMNQAVFLGLLQPGDTFMGLDLAAGKVAWKHRNGTIRDESPVPLPFKLGVPSLGGPIVTAGGVAFLGSALDDYLRAYDMETGHVLWKARLSAGGQASPMSYWSQASQRQFVVIAAGGHGTLGTKAGDSIVAYALPRKE